MRSTFTCCGGAHQVLVPILQGRSLDTAGPGAARHLQGTWAIILAKKTVGLCFLHSIASPHVDLRGFERMVHIQKRFASLELVCTCIPRGNACPVRKSTVLQNKRSMHQVLVLPQEPGHCLLYSIAPPHVSLRGLEQMVRAQQSFCISRTCLRLYPKGTYLLATRDAIIRIAHMITEYFKGVYNVHATSLSHCR